MTRAGDEVLTGAKWNLDPAGIPAPLQKAWMNVEFGNFPPAATEIQKGLKSSSAELKAGAEQLQQYVLAKMQESIEGAKSARTAGNHWEAYKRYAAASAEFQGYPISAEVDQAVRELAADEAVKGELAAMKRFDAAYKQLASSSTVSQKRARLALEALVKDSPATEAGQQAQTLLKQLP
jgi:hypothetical protein